MSEYRLTPDGVQARQLTKEELELLQLAEAKLTQVRAPRLIASARDRVYVAAMDGTGNNRTDPLAKQTIVSKLSDELRDLRNPSIGVGYTPGIGTQSRFIPRAIDGMAATTFEVRVEQAYLELCRQVFSWLKEDPDARIRVAGIGFSRGAEGIAALQRMVHERGIRDPSASESQYGSDGILQRITWADRPPLVSPGRTAQVALLIDPVATGLHDYDRLLPGSNVGALQFIAMLEARNHFPGTLLVPQGLSDGGRVASLLIPASHSDVGGSYTLDGTGRVIYNASVDYMNTALGGALLRHVPVAHDPRMFVVHRSDQHLAGLWPSTRWQREGERAMHSELGPSCEPAAVKPCTRDAIDYRLADELDYDYVVRGRPPGGTDAKLELARTAIDRMHEGFPTWLDRTMATSPGFATAQVLTARDQVREMFERMVESADKADDSAISAVTRAYVATPMGQVLKPGFLAAQAWLSRSQSQSQSQSHSQALPTQASTPHSMQDQTQHQQAASALQR